MAASWRVGVLLPTLALVSFSWLAYTLSPVDQIYDSRYSLLLAEQIYQRGSFDLRSFLPDDPQEVQRLQAPTINVERIGDRTYYFFPPGASLLSIPFSIAFNLLGWSASDDQGQYDYQAERFMQRQMAAFLMALLAGIVFLAARSCLSTPWSLALALALAFGSPLWSMLSRGLWSQTWAVLLLSLSILLILAAKGRWTPLVWLLLATLLSWCFFVRPISALSILGLSAWALWTRQRGRGWLILGGACWLAAFLVFSLLLYGKPLPSYYSASRLSGLRWGEGLLGNLVSPSRGLLILLPGTLFALHAVWRGRRSLWRLPLFKVAAFVCLIHWSIVSAYPKWWGGHGFGPRLMIDLLPWLILLYALTIRDWLSRSRPGGWRFRAEALGLLLLWCLSIGIHSQGALSGMTLRWNLLPADVDSKPARIWDWSDPQFLSAFRPRSVPD